MSSIASKLQIVALPLFFAIAACSSEASNEDPTATSESTALTDGSSRIVAVQSDENGAGYVVRALNCGGTRHVDALDLTTTGVDLRALLPSLAVPGAVALRGAIRSRTFVATDVFRALPAIAASRGDAFFTAKRAAPGGAAEATEVNKTSTLPFEQLDVSAVLAPFVDEAWLAGRVLGTGAVVAGSFDVSGDGALVLRASQLLVRVPEAVACPAPLFIACADGTSPAYERTAERCVVQTGCAAKGVCPRPIPACAPGYALATWTGGAGCAAYACDPAFDPAP